MSDVITLKEIEERARGQVIEIPDWDGRGTIKVRARKIDLTPIVLKAGWVPNSLKVKAKEVFDGKDPKDENFDIDVDLQKILPALDEVAKQALVDPKYDDIVKIMPLTLNQKLAIFHFVTEEVRQLESFRREP